MTAKEYLEQAQHIAQETYTLKAEMEVLMEIATASGAIRYDHDRVTGSAPQEARFEKTVIKYLDIQKRIKDELGLLLEKQEEIRSTVSRIKNTNARVVIRMRFLSFCSVDEIADKLKVSRRTVIRRMQDGYEEVEKLTGYPAPLKVRKPGRDRHAESRRILREVFKDK